MVTSRTLKQFLLYATIAAAIFELIKITLLPQAGWAFEGVWGSLVFLIIWHWFYLDARDRHYHRPLNFGLAPSTFWPLYAPYYLFHTRGWRGVWITLVLLMMIVLPSFMREVAIALL
ncbi:hypothetical protein [Halioxenophilus sp. WMMB6]|uniref:hypothetical protein n=1 Tax=Halioxenophilus sp. WMMB6 TaxID=3073815 RepID=UPI00295E486B|nr:hypothetical protein [Halioxenophilus sp. WMMB6]